MEGAEAKRFLRKIKRLPTRSMDRCRIELVGGAARAPASWEA